MVKNYRSSRSKKSGVSNLKNSGGEQLTVLIFLDLIQDLDLVVPILKKAKDRKDLAFKVCVTDWLANQSPRVENNLQLLEADYFVVSQHQVRAGIEPNLNGIQALITASETSAAPHESARVLTKRANQAGLLTYTLQHGFENIGLTYFDEIHFPDSIKFASQKILIWGTINSLSPEVLPETKKRCICVGCLKEIPTDIPQINISEKREYLVAVFENLHWHRYNENYRKQFLEHLEKTALHFSNTTFLIKPHHAGQWLTSRYQGKITPADNLIIADPKNPKWENYTAPALINCADAAITTPSTVALDAARADRPVSVVSYGLDLNLYTPLPLLNNLEDWIAFIDRLQNPEEKIKLINQTHRFVEKTIIPGDAVERIFDLILQDISDSKSIYNFGDRIFYPTQAAIDWLEIIPFEYKFRGISSEAFLNRILTERSLFYGDVLDLAIKAKVISLIILVDREPSEELALTLRSWDLQSCPLTNCCLMPLGDNSVKSLEDWLKTQEFSQKIEIWQDSSLEWSKINQKSDYILFARPGDILAPTLATRLKLIQLNDAPDVVVWNLQQLAKSQDDRFLVEEFLRRPQFELHTIRHLNYIGIGFAVKPSLASAYPYDLFEHICQNDAHLFHIWLSQNSQLKWHTYPEYGTLRSHTNKPDCLENLSKPFIELYQKLLESVAKEFEFELCDDRDLPYQLKPKRKAKSISVIIPFRDKPVEIIRCLESIEKQKFSGSLEIILVNNQSDLNTLTKINKYLKKYDDMVKIKIINYSFPFNHSRQCNLGVETATGEVIIFLNNDTEILTESAIEEMAAWSLVSGIGTVGCNLSSIDGKYGCAGIKARAIPSLKNLTFMAESTDLTYANVIRETYGNSFACTAIARSTYQNLGKLNEVEFFNGYNDVEFLERTRERGYTNIYLGHLKVNHSPGTSRGRCDKLIQSILLRERYTQTSADSLFQLERDEYLTNELKKLEKQKTQADTQKINEEIKNLKLENQKLKSEVTKFKIAEIKVKEEINAMKTSKFWQLRMQWFKIKRLFGIADE